MAEHNSMSTGAGSTALASAAKGSGSFLKGPAVRGLLIGGAAGATAVVAGRYWTRDMFIADDGSEDENARMKRGGVKIVGAVAIASMIRKWSPEAALGVALGGVVDGVADIIEDKGFEMLDNWFADDSSSSSGGSSSSSSGGSSSSSSSSTAQGIGYLRQVR